MTSERGFTLLETIATLAIAAILLTAGGIWMLGRHPGVLAQGTDDYDAALAVARTLAVTSGRGATLVFVPRRSRGGNIPGFNLRVYSGRPEPGASVTATTAMSLTSPASVSERTLGSPPFALFFGASGHVSGAPAYPRVDAAGVAQFAEIEREPACPSGGFILAFAAPPLARQTRTLACAATAPGIPGPPNPSPPPNLPTVTPNAVLYHWPADATQTLTATEWGYTHWFAAVGGFACGAGVAGFPNVLPSPYTPANTPAEAAATPSPPAGMPYSFPNSFGGGTNDAPAAFPLDPSGEGTCGALLADAYGQTARAGVRVMGWLTATYGGSSYAHRTKPSLKLPSTAFPQKGASVTLRMAKTYDDEPLRPQVAFDAACSPYVTFSAQPRTTPPIPSKVPATASLVLTLIAMPDSPIACGGAVYDQYPGSLPGEGVPFNATLGSTPCPNAGNAWAGPLDRICYDLYSIETGMTQTGGWTEASDVGFYVAHGTPGSALYRWIVGDGTCSMQNLIGTDFAQWGVLLGNGDATPPPVGTPAPIANPAGFGLDYVPDTAAVTTAPQPRPTTPPPWLCKPLPAPSPPP
ncbi:MAG TPA: prepilin-type N-terminal cleavage/methylation domain-containing protein [Candidatus Tumulicola sp.]